MNSSAMGTRARARARGFEPLDQRAPVQYAGQRVVWARRSLPTMLRVGPQSICHPERDQDGRRNH